MSTQTVMCLCEKPHTIEPNTLVSECECGVSAIVNYRSVDFVIYENSETVSLKTVSVPEAK